MASQPVFVSYRYAVRATAATPYVFAGLGSASQLADALLCTETHDADVQLTLADGSTTVNIGQPTVGTVIPIASTEVDFGGGTTGQFVAMKVQ